MKLIRRDELERILDGMRPNGKRIVFTNGCFDILHIGHLRCLQAARALGDCLVVGVNTDDTVRELKGPGRPIVGELDRAGLLAGLECVDYVTLFSEALPCELISELRPDIHVKGGDYTEEQMPEASVVRSYGGTVVILSLTEGRSTSQLLSLVRAAPETK